MRERGHPGHARPLSSESFKLPFNTPCAALRRACFFERAICRGNCALRPSIQDAHISSSKTGQPRITVRQPGATPLAGITARRHSSRSDKLPRFSHPLQARFEGSVGGDEAAARASRLGVCTVTKRTPAMIRSTASSFWNVSTSSPQRTPAVAATAGCT